MVFGGRCGGKIPSPPGLLFAWVEKTEGKEGRSFFNGAVNEDQHLVLVFSARFEPGLVHQKLTLKNACYKSIFIFQNPDSLSGLNSSYFFHRKNSCRNYVS